MNQYHPPPPFFTTPMHGSVFTQRLGRAPLNRLSANNIACSGDLSPALLQTLLYDDDATKSPYPDETYQRNVDRRLPPALIPQPIHPAAIDAFLRQALALELEHKPHLYSIRLIVLDFLCRQLQPNAPLLNWALCFIGQHCLNILADPSLHPLRRRIFAQCFKLRDTEGYRDLQIHRSLYDLLDDLRMPSCVWLMEIEASLHMQYHRCLQLCERILETQVTRPSLCSIHAQQFAEAIPPSTLAKSLSMQMRLALYHALAPAEIAPLLKYLTQMNVLVPRECFQLSAPFTLALRECSAPLLALLNCEIDSMTEQFFADSKLEALCLDDALLTELQGARSTQFSTGLMEECFQVVGTAPPRFMAQITLLNISLMQTFLQFHHNQDITWADCCRLCDSAWTHAFASLLDRAVFETCPASDSPSIRSLSRLCFSYIVLRSVLDIDRDTSECERLYRHYQEQRSLFLASFESKKQQQQLSRDLAIVQRLMST